MNNNVKLEDMFAELNNLVKELESPDIELEEAFNKYTKGMELIKKCNSSIETIEQKLIILEESEG